MQILDQSKLWGDEFKVEHPPLLAAKFGRGIVPAEDDTYYIMVQSGSMQTTCIPIQHEDIGDISTPAISSATICTLAIRAGLSSVPISGIVCAIDESIWVDDYSDEKALEIKIEPERKHYYREPLYQELYRIYRECSKSGWDIYSSIPISVRVFLEATKLLDLLPSDSPSPEVTPEPTGEIAFEWYKGKNHVFVISIGGKNTISYAGLFGRHSKTYGAEYFFDELPRLVVDNVSRLFS
jgi:hypothetical protein